MKKNKKAKKRKNNWKLILTILILGLVVGFVIGHTNTSTNPQILTSTHQHINTSINQLWTCSMHPQIKQEEPGDCPICGMDLIPLASMDSNDGPTDANAVTLSESAAKLADIQTTIVRKGTPEKQLYLQGKVQANEKNIAQIAARFNGRIEQLFVNFTGQKVRKGEKLASIYSPDLVSAQKELIEAIALKDTRPSLYNAAVSKLKLWDISDAQIQQIESQQEPLMYFDVLSPISGTVTMRMVAKGDYVKEGQNLFQVIDLSNVWVMFDAYESDLPWIKTGDAVSMNFKAVPGKEFNSKVSFIDPMLDAKTRVAKVRVEIANKDGKLKPEMFANGVLESKIADQSNVLLIPKSAILWTGKRAVVYVKVPNQDAPSFTYREITLGAEAGENYIVADGLGEGEEIASNGVFKIDAAAQLQGLPSMMNPDGGKTTTGHNHGEMEMSSNITSSATSEMVMIRVSGNCGMCKDRIETAAKSIDGVTTAEWSAETQLLHLMFDPAKTSSEEVQKTIAAVGQDTELFKAADSVYNELPECCLYERMNK